MVFDKKELNGMMVYRVFPNVPSRLEPPSPIASELTCMGLPGGTLISLLNILLALSAQ